MHDSGPLRLDQRARDEASCLQLRVEEEAVVVVDPAARRVGRVGARRCEHDRRPGPPRPALKLGFE